LRSQFDDRQVRVEVVDLNALTGNVTGFFPGRAILFADSLPLKTFYTADSSGGLTVEKGLNASIPLSGKPELYPDDTYNLYVSLEAFLDQTHIGGSDDSPPAFANTRFNTDSISGWIFNQHQGGKLGSELNLSISRDPRTVAYIHVFALIPFAFGLLFLHLLFFNPGTRSSPLGDFLVALSASTLAILPLRAVLVPSEIAGVTRVDYLLGFGLVVLVAIGMLRYAYDLWSQRPEPIQGSPRREQSGSAAPELTVLVGDEWRSSDGRWRWDGEQWVVRDT
jgi:hypothetical protein